MAGAKQVMIWTPKSIDVCPVTWKQVKAAAAAAGVEVRVWLHAAIKVALKGNRNAGR